jgi:hypothetical protein
MGLWGGGGHWLGRCGVDSPDSGWGALPGSSEHDDETSGFGVAVLDVVQIGLMGCKAEQICRWILCLSLYI